VYHWPTPQAGCTAELEGVTYIGQTDIGAVKNAPSISMYQPIWAVWVLYDSLVKLRGKVLACTAAHLLKISAEVCAASTEAVQLQGAALLPTMYSFVHW
jgi:hypothetical protein